MRAVRRAGVNAAIDRRGTRPAQTEIRHGILEPMSPWGLAPWRITVTPPPIPVPRHARVVIVGGGVTGLSTLWHLARRGFAPLLLEASRLGHGASGRTGGLVLEGTAWGPLPGADRVLETLAETIANLPADCRLRLDGCDLLVHANPAPDRLRRWYDEGRPLCLASRESGGMVDAGALLEALACNALACGARIREATPALAVDSGRIATPAGTIRAERIVVTVNAWLNRLLPGTPAYDTFLTPAVATVPLGPGEIERLDLAHGRPFYTLDRPFLWGRLLPDRRLVFGAGLLPTPCGRPEDVDLRDAAVARELVALERRVRSLHPVLESVAIDTRWVGPIAFPRRPAPLLGTDPTRPGVLVAAGCGGHGLALGVHLGRLLASTIADGSPLPAWGELGS